MAANKEPIFVDTGVLGLSGGVIATANTAMDGTGTQVTVATGQANGTYVSHLKLKAAGTNVATVLRVFINNGSTNATASNNTLYAELTLPATTASNTTGLYEAVVPLGFVLPNTYKINCAIGTSVSAGWHITAVGGNY